MYQNTGINTVSIDASGIVSNPSIGGTANGMPHDGMIKFDGNDGIAIDASRGNSVYNGSKVQTSALQMLACIRC